MATGTVTAGEYLYHRRLVRWLTPREAIIVPSQFHETIQRKVEHIDELLVKLATVVQPMGLSQVDFQHWLLKAIAAAERQSQSSRGAATRGFPPSGRRDRDDDPRPGVP